MNYAEYYSLHIAEGQPRTALLVLLDPHGRAKRSELHVPNGIRAAALEQNISDAQQLLRERYGPLDSALPLYVLAMDAQSAESRFASPHSAPTPVTAEYFDLSDGSGEPLAGLLVLLDNTRYPTHAELYFAASVDPETVADGLNAAHRQLHHRYNLDSGKPLDLAVLRVEPRGTSRIEPTPAVSSAPPQWTSPVERAGEPVATETPSAPAGTRMGGLLPYIAIGIIALGVLLGLWALTAILGRSNSAGALPPPPMGETHPDTTSYDGVLAQGVVISPLITIATGTPAPTLTPERRDTYCIWPRETLSEIALNAGVTEEAIRTHNPDFTGNAGTTVELPPGSILPENWAAPPPLVPAIEAIPFGISGYYIGYDNRSKRVALSFDVGYVEGNQELMESLAEQGIRATFFVLGGAVENHPEMIGHVLDNGHELGNHSYTHDNMLSMSAEEIRSELVVTENLVQAAYPGATTKPIFRAPFGAINETVVNVANEEGYHVVGWTVDSRDWTDEITAQALYERVTTLVCPGAIIALHDVNPASAVALPQVLVFLRENGYEFVTVGDMLFPPGS